MEQDRAIIRNEVLTRAPSWTNLDDVMPSQIGLSQKGGYDPVTQSHTNEVPRALSLTETESRSSCIAYTDSVIFLNCLLLLKIASLNSLLLFK